MQECQQCASVPGHCEPERIGKIGSASPPPPAFRPLHLLQVLLRQMETKTLDQTQTEGVEGCKCEAPN